MIIFWGELLTAYPQKTSFIRNKKRNVSLKNSSTITLHLLNILLVSSKIFKKIISTAPPITWEPKYVTIQYNCLTSSC